MAHTDSGELSSGREATRSVLGIINCIAPNHASEHADQHVT
jgi:hypothetical protein